MRRIVLQLLAVLSGICLVEIPCSGVEHATLQDMLGAHMDRVMRKSGLIFHTRHGEPWTNWFGRVIMDGADALPSGYQYIQLRDSDGWAEVRDEDGVLTREVAPIRYDAAFVLGDLFGFVPNEDTPPELRLSHLVSKWLVCDSEEESDATDLTEEELRILASTRSRRISRVASAQLVVTNLQVTAISVESDRVTFVTEWPSSMTFQNNRLDLYTSVDLRGVWTLHGSYDVTGVNAITTTVMKASIAGFLEGQRVQHDDDCYITTNIVASAFEPGVTYTNRHWNCEHKARAETPGFFRWADQTDSDGDTLTDAAEKWVHGTNPELADSDGDGIADNIEIGLGINPNERDSDGDGLEDDVELSLGTNAGSADSDGDGILDGDEYGAGTNPTNPDSDGDGVNDGDEQDDQRDPTFNEDDMDDPPLGDGIYYSVGGTADVSIESRETNDVENVELPTISIESGAQDVSFSISWAPKFYVEITGLTFVPSVSGIYEFEIEGDDDATLSVGSVSVEGHYRSPGQGFFKAGVSYDIKVTLYNDGGPAGLTCTKFGKLVKMYRERFENSFDTNAVIFEDAYENKPGARVKKNSTYVISKIIATGGPNGGVLRVRGNYDRNLSLRCGTGCAPGDYELGPYEQFVRVGIYEGNVPSESIGDVRKTAQWIPNRSDDTSIITANLTVIKMSLQADSLGQDNHERHHYGINEFVSYTTMPESVGAWSADSGVSIEWDNTFRMPQHECSGNFTFTYGGAHLSSRWSCFEPHELRALSVAPMVTSSNWIAAGKIPPPDGAFGAGMTIGLQLYPNHVSFMGLNVFEGACPATNKYGVFSLPGDQNYDHALGRPITVGLYNMTGNDYVGFWITTRNNELPGFSGFELCIPHYWFLDEEVGCHLFGTAVQRCVIFSNGDAAVYKFGRSMRRCVNGTYITD